MSLKKTAQHNSPGQQTGGGVFELAKTSSLINSNNTTTKTRINKLVNTPDTELTDKLNTVLDKHGFKQLPQPEAGKTLKIKYINQNISKQIEGKVNDMCTETGKTTQKRELAEKLQREFINYLENTDASGNPIRQSITATGTPSAIRATMPTGQMPIRTQSGQTIRSSTTTYSSHTPLSTRTSSSSARKHISPQPDTPSIKHSEMEEEAEEEEEMLEEAEEHVAEAQSKLNETKQEQQNLTAATTGLENVREKIQTLGAMASEAGNVGSVMSELKQMLSVLKPVVAQLVSAGENSEAEKVKSIANNIDATAQGVNASNNTKGLKEELEKIKKQLTEEQEKVQKAEKEKAAEVEKLQTELATAQKEKEMAEAKAKKAAENKAASNTEKRAAENKATKLEEELKAKTQKIAQTTQEIEKLKETITETRKTKNEASNQQDKTAATQELAELQTKLVKLTTELETEKKYKQQIQEKLIKAEQELEEVKASKTENEISAELQKQAAEMNAKSTEITQLKAQINELEEKKTTDPTQDSDITSLLEKLKAELITKENEYSEVNDTLSSMIGKFSQELEENMKEFDYEKEITPDSFSNLNDSVRKEKEYTIIEQYLKDINYLLGFINYLLQLKNKINLSAINENIEKAKKHILSISNIINSNTYLNDKFNKYDIKTYKEDDLKNLNTTYLSDLIDKNTKLSEQFKEKLAKINSLKFLNPIKSYLEGFNYTKTNINVYALLDMYSNFLDVIKHFQDAKNTDLVENLPEFTKTIIESNKKNPFFSEEQLNSIFSINTQIIALINSIQSKEEESKNKEETNPLEKSQTSYIIMVENIKPKPEADPETQPEPQPETENKNRTEAAAEGAEGSVEEDVEPEPQSETESNIAQQSEEVGKAEAKNQEERYNTPMPKKKTQTNIKFNRQPQEKNITIKSTQITGTKEYIIRQETKDNQAGYLLSYKNGDYAVFMPETNIQTISHDEMKQIWKEMYNLKINCIFAIYKDNDDGNTYVFNKFSFTNRKTQNGRPINNSEELDRKVISDSQKKVELNSTGCTSLIKLISLTPDQFKPEYFKSINPNIPKDIQKHIADAENSNESQAGGKKLTWRTVKQYFTPKKHTSKTKKHRKTLKKHTNKK